MTAMFKTTVGVKQGGPLSPKLFSIYVESMIEEIIQTDFIAKIREIKTGLIMYADDILILTESTENMRKKLKICEKHGVQLEIKFNPKKLR